MTTTVQNIIDGIKWVTDLQAGNRLADADLIPEIDAAYKEAWEIIVGTYEDYFLKHIDNIAITGGSGLNTYQVVATDFWKLKAIQKLNGSTYNPPLPTYPFAMKGAVQELSYLMLDDTIHFEPELSCAGTYRLWYVYTPADLTAVGNTIVDRNNMGVKRFIIDTVATRATIREEEDSTAIASLRQALQQRVEKMAQARQLGRRNKIADTRPSRSFRFMTRSGLTIPS